MTKEFARRRKRILQIEERLCDLEVEKANLEDWLHNACPHSLVIHFDGAYPETRICGLCGLREEFGSTGFHKLVAKPFKHVNSYELNRWSKLRRLEDIIDVGQMKNILAVATA